MIKSSDCLAKTLADDQLCLSQFEGRIRKLWTQIQKINRDNIFDQKNLLNMEIDSFCWYV